MKKISFIAAVTLFAATTAFAQQTPVANSGAVVAANAGATAAANSSAAVAANASIAATKLNVPTAPVVAGPKRTRAEVRAEAEAAVFDQKGPLDHQLDMTK